MKTLSKVSVSILYKSYILCFICIKNGVKKGKRKVQGIPQSHTAALSRHKEEEETDKTK